MASAGYGQRAGAVTLHTATCCREVLGDLLLPIRASGERTGSLWLRQSRAGCLATQGERGRGSLALAGTCRRLGAGGLSGNAGYPGPGIPLRRRPSSRRRRSPAAGGGDRWADPSWRSLAWPSPWSAQGCSSAPAMLLRPARTRSRRFVCKGLSCSTPPGSSAAPWLVSASSSPPLSWPCASGRPGIICGEAGAGRSHQPGPRSSTLPSHLHVHGVSAGDMATILARQILPGPGGEPARPTWRSPTDRGSPRPPGGTAHGRRGLPRPRRKIGWPDGHLSPKAVMTITDRHPVLVTHRPRPCVAHRPARRPRLRIGNRTDDH
jgi:hypothetical protein